MAETCSYFLDKCSCVRRDFKVFATECSMAQENEFYEIKLNNVLAVTHCNIWNNFQSTCELSVEDSTGHFDKPHSCMLLPETETLQLIHS